MGVADAICLFLMKQSGHLNIKHLESHGFDQLIQSDIDFSEAKPAVN